MPPQVDVAIVGGGPGGLAAAVALLTANSDLKVKVYERARSLRPAGFVVGILPNGLKAIEAISPELRASLVETMQWKDQELRTLHYLQDGTLRKEIDGTAARLRYERYGGGLFPVSWYDLQCWLASWLPEGVLQTNSEFERYEEVEGGVVAHFRGGVSCQAKLLIGCDGNLSQVRKQLLNDGMPTFGGLAVWRAMTMKPKEWPVEAGVVGWDDAGFKTQAFSVAFPDGRLSWNIAAPWPEEKAGILGSRRYIADHSKEGTPSEKLDRCLAALGPNWPEALRSYESVREPMASAVQQASANIVKGWADRKSNALQIIAVRLPSLHLLPSLPRQDSQARLLGVTAVSQQDPSMNTPLDGLEALPEAQKQQLMQKIEEMQVRDSLRMYNTLVERCFKDCVDNSFRRKDLESSEEKCVTRCCEKFMKGSARIGMQFAKLSGEAEQQMQQLMQQQQQ
ncbi:hypothetical protein WJX72_003718 [[Myrmecia] bisecta]|uniref:Tim10-like domain-containing protein n=1 Tax=[Myrmecia] bisecta TaxID=41462 RepID=A0AAW1PL29_9CHLO